MVMVKRGLVVLCDLNPIFGSEQRGIRPAVVVQNDAANLVSPHTIIVPFTTRIRNVILPSHVFIPKEQGNLTEDSVILCEQIRTIDKKRILNIFGNLSPDYLTQVDLAIMSILGIKIKE